MAGKHRAKPAQRTHARRVHRVGVPGVAGVALVGVAALGVTPALTPFGPSLALGPTQLVAAETQLAAQVYYLRGTNIGDEPTDSKYLEFIQEVLSGTSTTTDGTLTQVEYPASIWPVSKGFLGDAKWNDSVADGVENLHPGNAGNVVFGFSQGAVVASKYKAAHPDDAVDYILVENPSRPNGGVMARFEGLTIPIMDLTFSGPTPVNRDDDAPGETIDIARQYDGWADFPTYPLNVLATANAVMGIALVHGKTQTQLKASDLTTAAASGEGSMYYQQHGDTTYYLVRTDDLPLLAPVRAVSPELADALDPPLRTIIETGYDRTDYSKHTRAQLLPSPASLQKSLENTAKDLKTTAAESDDTYTTPGKLSAKLTGETASVLAKALKPLAPASQNTLVNRSGAETADATLASVSGDGAAQQPKKTSLKPPSLSKVVKKLSKAFTGDRDKPADKPSENS